MKWLRKLIRYLAFNLLGLTVFAGLYFLAALILGSIPAKQSATASSPSKTIYLLSNGIHVDVVIPVSGLSKSVRNELLAPFARHSVQWLAIGWGDQGFYMNTERWEDLKAGTAFRALFWRSPTAMHVGALSQAPHAGPHLREIQLSPAQFDQLMQFVEQSFATDSGNHLLLLDHPGYAGYPNRFFEAKGSYHLFRTCNQWTNEALDAGSISVPLWTPFAGALMDRFPENPD